MATVNVHDVWNLTICFSQMHTHAHTQTQHHYVQDKVFVGINDAPESFSLLDKLQGPGVRRFAFSSLFIVSSSSFSSSTLHLLLSFFFYNFAFSFSTLPLIPHLPPLPTLLGIVSWPHCINYRCQGVSQRQRLWICWAYIRQRELWSTLHLYQVHYSPFNCLFFSSSIMILCF